MLEFLADVVKLFTDIDEDQPLPLQHRIIAIVIVGIVSALTLYFLLLPNQS